jgi:hypothetical protein
MCRRHAARITWIVLAFLSAIPLAVGAEIGRLAGRNFDLIGLAGPISAADVLAFRNAADASRKAIVILDSEGGDARAGMEMGRIIHRKNFATLVPENSLCASSCALMWLGGNPRGIKPGGAVGFHAVYLQLPGGQLMTSSDGNALVGAYLNQLGFSENVITFVTQAAPQKMGYLSDAVARGIGLDVVWGELINTPEPQVVPNEVSQRPYDPVSAVTRFYQALGAADGDTAAALVIPEKRGIRPFNELEMAKFFGDMREPLRLRSAPLLLGPDLVQVEYRYVHRSGRVCNTGAKVTTKYLFGKTFIEKISGPTC